MWLLNNAQDVLRLFCATSAVLKLHNSKTGQFFPFGRSFIALRTFNLAHLHHLKHSVWAFLKYLPICWLNTASLLEIVLFSLTFCFAPECSDFVWLWYVIVCLISIIMRFLNYEMVSWALTRSKLPLEQIQLDSVDDAM